MENQTNGNQYDFWEQDVYSWPGVVVLPQERPKVPLLLSQHDIPDSFRERMEKKRQETKER